MDIPDAATLERLYLEEAKSLAEIGRLYGVHKTQVRRWLVRATIPTRSISEATSLATRGKPKSETHRAKLLESLEKARAAQGPESYAKISARNKGREVWNKGKSWTPEERVAHMAVRDDEYRRKISESQKGEKSVHWRGGHDSRAPRGWEWRRIAKSVYERDRWTCQDCGVRCTTKGSTRIQCHHIIRRRDGGSDDPKNLVTLCVTCHIKRERAADDALFA